MSFSAVILARGGWASFGLRRWWKFLDHFLFKLGLRKAGGKVDCETGLRRLGKILDHFLFKLGLRKAGRERSTARLG